MNILYPELLDTTKSRGLVELKCCRCEKIFTATKNIVQRVIKNNDNKVRLKFCSKACSDENQKIRNSCNCKHCGKTLLRTPSQLSAVKNVFCSQSCGANYNNTHKTQGNRRSKLEIWLETKITELYPTLEIHFNRKDAINSELDIYFPTLKLAVELNGIFHYEPIYGADKLSQIQNNDNRKFQACLEKNIELVIIDTSWIKNHKEIHAQKILNIICNVLNIKLVFPAAIEAVAVLPHS